MLSTYGFQVEDSFVGNEFGEKVIQVKIGRDGGADAQEKEVWIVFDSLPVK